VDTWLAWLLLGPAPSTRPTAEQVSAILSAGLTPKQVSAILSTILTPKQVSTVLSTMLAPKQVSAILSAVLILEYVTKVRSSASTAERSQVANAPAVRETSAPPTASVRWHRHHRANVSTLTGDAEVPPDKTRRTQRHRESGTHEGTTGQPSRTRSPH
jgi:hypothetical protein